MTYYQDNPTFLATPDFNSTIANNRIHGKEKMSVNSQNYTEDKVHNQ